MYEEPVCEGEGAEEYEVGEADEGPGDEEQGAVGAHRLWGSD